MREVFDSIELIKKDEMWDINRDTQTYVAKNNKSSIFIKNDHGKYKLLTFNKGSKFNIDDDYIVYDETKVIES